MEEKVLPGYSIYFVHLSSLRVNIILKGPIVLYVSCCSHDFVINSGYLEIEGNKDIPIHMYHTLAFIRGTKGHSVGP